MKMVIHSIPLQVEVMLWSEDFHLLLYMVLGLPFVGTLSQEPL